MLKQKLKQTKLGEIPEGWRNARLGDLVTFHRGYDLPKSKFEIGPYPIAGSNGVIGHHNEFTTKGPGVTIGRSGNIGTPYYYEGDFWAHNTTLFVEKFHNCDSKFIYYLLSNLDLSGYNSGSAVPSLNRNYIHPIEVCAPQSVVKQRAIAKILSDLDAKIELNRQMNKTLESIAQAIFKRWFVDFEFPNEHGKPYKLSGGKMIDLELGEIPADWKVDSATQLFKLEYGWHLPEWDRKEGNVPVFGSGGLTGYHNSHFVDGPGIIIGRAGKVGVDSVYYSHSHFCPIETTFYVLVENKKIIRYLYLFLKTLNTVNTGSSVPNLSRRDIHNAKIIIPKVELIEKFDKISEKIFDFIENKKNETQSLIQIRDSLLPKLMSGRIKVGKCYSRMVR